MISRTVRLSLNIHFCLGILAYFDPFCVGLEQSLVLLQVIHCRIAIPATQAIDGHAFHPICTMGTEICAN